MSDGRHLAASEIERKQCIDKIAQMQRIADSSDNFEGTDTYVAALRRQVEELLRELVEHDTAQRDKQRSLAQIIGVPVAVAYTHRTEDERPAHETKTHITVAPLNAEYLFYLFMTPQNCDALVGDLEERYKLIHKKFGRRRADIWYWAQTVMSLGPIAWAWGRKVLIKPAMAVGAWAVTKGLVGHDSWLAALVEMVKRVRS